MNNTFDSCASKYDVNIRKSIPNYPEICKFTAQQFKGRKKILDAGCGTGTVSLLLAEQGSYVTCLDTSRNMLGVAKRKAESGNLDKKLIFKNAKIERTSYKNQFDGLLCNFLLYFTDRRNAIPALIKSVKHNGKVVITDISSTNSLLGRFRKYWLRLTQVLNSTPVADLWTKEQTLKLLKKQGLKNIRVKKISSTLIGIPIIMFTAKKA